MSIGLDTVTALHQNWNLAMVNTAALAELGSLVGDPGRANMLSALLDGRALTARELAECAGVTAQTASGHLMKLLAAGMLSVERQGRHKYHRLASAEVANMLEVMHVAATQLAPRGIVRTGPDDSEMRLARSCYDHIAGRLGVCLADRLSGQMDMQDRVLRPSAERLLGEWGLDVRAMRGSKRPFCRPCLDWSERRHHLAGVLGAALLDRSQQLGWLHRRDGTRSLFVTQSGRVGFQRYFSVTLD